MRIAFTNTGKRFIVDRCTPVVVHQGGRFWRTALGNIVREDIATGVITEIDNETVKANILLLPYDLAAQMFPQFFIDNPETI